MLRAKAAPGQINYGSGGVGSGMHLAAVLFQARAGAQFNHVPYKGGNAGPLALLANEIPLLWTTAGGAAAYVDSGRLRALAVSSKQRASTQPDLPTTEEAGVPNSAQPFWVGMGVPGKTPRDIVAKLHAETVKALNSPEIKARWVSLNQDVRIFTPEAFDALLREEVVSNAKLVKDANIKAN